MASSSNDKEKTPPEDDHLDLQLKEEVESEAEEEEMEEDQSSRPSTMIASIGVVTSHDKFKKSARIRTGGGVPCHSLAPRTSSSGNNPSILSYMSINSKGCLKQNYPLVGI
jgi:hypothetical protein